MPGDVINSSDSDYIMSRIRASYLNTSTVTIVLVGRYTWTRRFVDWEIGASLRNTLYSNRNGLLAISLPSVSDFNPTLPVRLVDNLSNSTRGGYARYVTYPTSADWLGYYIDLAFADRTNKADLVQNSRALLGHNLTHA